MPETAAIDYSKWSVTEVMHSYPGGIDVVEHITPVKSTFTFSVLGFKTAGSTVLEPLESMAEYLNEEESIHSVAARADVLERIKLALEGSPSMWCRVITEISHPRLGTVLKRSGSGSWTVILSEIATRDTRPDRALEYVLSKIITYDAGYLSGSIPRKTDIPKVRKIAEDMDKCLSKHHSTSPPPKPERKPRKSKAGKQPD